MHVRSKRGAALLALTLSGCVGEVGPTDKEKNGGGPDDAVFKPAQATIHRLTAPQLQNTYLALFGEPLVLPDDLPNDDVLYGFTSIAAAGATISSLDAEKYENATY